MYKFPIIKHIDDVLPFIENNPEFLVIKKDDYKVIDYVYTDSDTFGNIEPDIDSNSAAIRRECRGLIFDLEGNLIRRAFQKFFNYGEKAECRDLPDGVDLLIQEKLDGSMVTPFLIPNKGIRWATRKGVTDVSMKAENFITSNLDRMYMEFAEDCISIGLTPVFEWLDSDVPIVVKHPESNLVLTAVRNMETGEYVECNNAEEAYNIPVLKYYATQGIQDFAEAAKKLEYAEGWVVTWPDGSYKFKLKGDWYVSLHGLVDKTSSPRKVIEIILKGQMDDIKPILLNYPELGQKVEKFEKDLWEHINYDADLIKRGALTLYASETSKKDFALGIGAIMKHFPKAVTFKLMDWMEFRAGTMDGQMTMFKDIPERTRQLVIDYIMKSLHSEKSYNTLINNGGLSDRFKTI